MRPWRLPNYAAHGTLWPLPIVLDVPESVARTLGAGARLALRDPEGVLLASLGGARAQADTLEEQMKKFGMVHFEEVIPAPDFTLTTPDGAPLRLSDFKGHPVLLNFWTTW